MSYLVLARKYRPHTFEEVAGQDGPMRMLQGAIREGRIGHAYLFCGPRGTGKTTSARIFAKALMCEKGPTPEPCGTCAHCTNVDQGSEVDLIEIDGASNRGIEDARELREGVGYSPMSARFKVYIVDEVHMLTKEAFNALLKTLEEPPPHVKFLFATTEPQKVLETIRSRCQLVRLSLIREEVIAARLAEIFARESVAPGEGVVDELARHARGSLRDALSLADQVLALSGSTPTLEDVRRAAGQSGAERIEALLARVEAGDRAGVLEALAAEGDESELVSGLLDHLRGALLAALCPADSGLFDSDPGELERRAARARRVGAERLQAWIEELLHARERIAHVPEHARLVLEVALLELCRPEVGLALAVLEERLAALERRLELGSAPAADKRSAPPAARASAPPAAPASAPAAASQTARAPRPAANPVRESLPRVEIPARPAPPPAPAKSGERDEFTRAVADLFTGKIEEESR